ncbi:MAG: hypothetical protein OXI23_10070 [Gemmatimonadota bacterium]|nr:hypothetical protein [Gemmatimonadota bacterium]
MMAHKKTRAYSVLFEQDVGDDDTLFVNPANLAIRMNRWGLHSNPRNLAAYLNQIFSRGERSCSSELQEQLNKAIDKQLEIKFQSESKLQSDLWKKRLARAIEADNADFAFPHPLNAKQLTYDLFERAEYAGEQFIITSFPPEFVLTEDAITFQNILIRRLGLINFEDEQKPDVPKVRCTFNFPSEEMAERWWWALSDAVVFNAERNFLYESPSSIDYNLNQASANLRRLNKILDEGRGTQQERTSEFDNENRIQDELKTLNDNRNLVVQVISPELCALPIVAFDPTEGNASAYVFFYFDGIRNEGGRAVQDSLSVAKLDRHAYMTWREAVYRPIRRGQIGAKEIKYSEIVLKT